MASCSPTFKAGPLITLANPRQRRSLEATHTGSAPAKLRTIIRDPNWHKLLLALAPCPEEAALSRALWAFHA
jgi:hypothetical protein